MSRFAIKERQTLGKWVIAVTQKIVFQHKGERQKKAAPKFSRLRLNFMIFNHLFF